MLQQFLTGIVFEVLAAEHTCQRHGDPHQTIPHWKLVALSNNIELPEVSSKIFDQGIARVMQV